MGFLSQTLKRKVSFYVVHLYINRLKQYEFLKGNFSSFLKSVLSLLMSI